MWVWWHDEKSTYGLWHLRTDQWRGMAEAKLACGMTVITGVRLRTRRTRPKKEVCCKECLGAKLPTKETVGTKE